MTAITFACKPRTIVNKVFDKTTVMLNPRQKWICEIKDNIYSTSRQGTTLNLSYEEFYELFREI